MTTTSIPKYRKQRRASGDMAFVVLNGHRFYLGPFGSPASQQQYHQLLAEFNAAGGQLPVAPPDLTVVELIGRFWKHVKRYYRKADGTPTSEVENFRYALKPLKKLYGSLPACQFSPLKLKAVRQTMIEAGLARTHINRQVSRLKLMFRWGTEYELVPADTLHALNAVAGLKRGRTDALESDPVKPVPPSHVDAVRPYVSRQVWGLIQLQLHTAARAGELVRLRTIDLDMSGKIWIYTPTDHKTAHHGRQRTIYFGPQAQAVLKGFMGDRPLDAYLFSPQDAVAEKAAKAQTHRRKNQKPNKRRTQRKVREYYDTHSYRRAIHRACDEVGVPRWSPHRLRHSAATYIRKEYGLEAAQLMLGHARADVTQLYAEIDREKAMAIAAKIG